MKATSTQKNHGIKKADLTSSGLQCTAYASEDDLPDTSDCIVALLKSGDNSIDPDGVAEFIIVDGDGDDGHYVWWTGTNLSSGWVDVDFDIQVGADIEWAVDGTVVSDDSLEFGDINAVAISVAANATGVSLAWNGINVSFYDSSGVVHDAPGVPSGMWPDTLGGTPESAVYITPSDTSIPIVRVHVTGSVKLTRPTTNPVTDQALVGKIFIYAADSAPMRAAVYPRRRASRP
jgi:hypothetical protein